jgi:poly(3-hydroxybutyrate) depolymerase
MVPLKHTNQSSRLADSVWLTSILAVLLGALSCNPSCPPVGSGIILQTLRFDASDYSYYFFAPRSTQTNHALPLLFLVHGGGGNGLHFLRLWQDFARQNQINLLAPTLSFGDDLEKRVPELFPAFVEDAKTRFGNIDPKRIYVFGYSEGGYLAFDAATLDSTYFAAATVLAGVVTPDYDWIAARARRKTPIAMYMGDRDHLFSLAQSERTRDMLLAYKFPIHYVAFKEKHYNYGADFAWVKQDSWDFMREYRLP